ncbi:MULTISPECIES: protease modulator HflC [unclassified Gilliamella]|uniref:protease modulator HflC n=1 Tax=unclassified Gilliamella TaxID=2685620 RepID=UPI00130845C8|nr:MULTISPECIES: protease modulator HflC [unclassified Gilliamella]MWP49778.1 protease modulator HflC [Gilliamella sp. Lep-s35]MWP69493.1 protease modulator HflC [Gilliamella sp. Lep-s5]MWP77757.1 protease modulator HflC [Gilliamella sp. Lep-s21]
MRKLLIPIILILVGMFFSSAYVVEEGTRGVVLRFNKIIKLSDPGLHFKIPGMDKVKVIDAKIQTINNSNNIDQDQKFVTRENKDLVVNYFVQWRVVDFNRYYEAIIGNNNVENLLLVRLNSCLKSEIGKLNATDILNGSHNSILTTIKNALNSPIQETVENKSVENITNGAEKDFESNKISMKSFGIEVVDIRIKKIDFPQDESKSIYDKMKDNQYSQDAKRANEIQAEATLEVAKILSEAERQSQAIRGEGDANAAKIYADAFSNDVEFFSFIRSLKAYEQSFTGNDVMVISSDSKFLQYMKLKSNN